ncbi:DAL5-Allantoate ureidosuccinate permease [Fusarium circinatum]|uniref:DAL5-Allantoate ureidosuccinate permease n=1 Tax=Fusarium circinatum TaxID=48490 RepID=A0A8H5T779_FUSCI|nr:DAL5-Allantoate ureidosuccinate permease [Fusarium circinatum]
MSAPPSFDAPWSLNGKTAMVTGGSRGIGQAISVHLARKGLTKLAITYASNIEAAEETLKRCQELGVEQAIAIKADALDPHFGPKTISEVVQRLGTPVIDILVNNAILSDPAKALPIKDTSLDVFLEIIGPTVAYGASKTALKSYTRAFAENFSKLKKATFNSVVVGLTATDSIKASQHMMPPGFLNG